MIKLNYKNKNFNKFFKEAFDRMIPEDKNYKMIPFSKAVNLNSFLKKIFLNHKTKKKLEKALNKSLKNKKSIEYLKLENLSTEQLIIEKILGDHVLEAYFGSNKIIKILDKKTKMLLSNVKLNRDSMLSVLKVAKNKLPIYKEHN